MTLKELINRLNEFNIDKYGDCQVCRPHGLWSSAYVNSVDITPMVNEHGKTIDCIFIDVESKN